MLSPEILAYYQRGGETSRLSSGAGRLEFLRTWDVLTRVLPVPPATIVDVGGATGVYAGPLAVAGHAVRVIDPVPDHVAAAAGVRGVTAELGDARELPVPDDSADAVLLLGPLYHLRERADRLTAWREALRVVRPGGVVVGAAISRYAALFDGLSKNLYADPEFDDAVTDGEFGGGGYFTSAYLHHPAEARAEAEAAGLAGARTVIVEGPLAFADKELQDILADPVRTELTLDRLRVVEADPGMAAATGHLLVIGHRGGQ
ncbi:bifunctional 2-polyprenyl-6-hydroxyphenol methylase/3-demethylubiquinol 3-O-methyltransferase UbiG [Actinoplanes sp. N902-109]|uniref:class I SAM-dependent methyltransferase n=1 Tax=Actinoplanes sp. (strain N902-109) TaxID=649831 RepID=UPI000686F57D|nr:class I SAM-dependent methyltransferase [Actinoplanes sp. N902-109]